MLRGDFGILDAMRTDVTYESYKGRRLDRKMLELPREGEGLRATRLPLTRRPSGYRW